MFWTFKLAFDVEILAFFLGGGAWQLFWLLFSQSWVILFQSSGHLRGCKQYVVCFVSTVDETVGCLILCFGGNV
jgi:hypothetical protein